MEDPNSVTKALLDFNAFDQSYVFEDPASVAMSSRAATDVLTTARETTTFVLDKDPAGQPGIALDLRKYLGLRDLPSFKNLEATVAQMPGPQNVDTEKVTKIAIFALIVWAMA